jgi:hypothetical protein
MSVFLFLALAFALLSVVCSHEYVREFLLTWVPTSVEQWVATWAGFVLASLVAAFLLVGMLRTPRCTVCGEDLARDGIPSHTAENRDEGKILSDGREVPSGTSARGNIVTFRIVHQADGDKMAPLPNAIVRVGQDENTSDESGKVRLLLSTPPAPDTLVRISEKLHLSRFLRFDDPIIASRQDVQLTPKMRVVVVDPSEGNARGADSLEAIRRNLESHFANSEIELLADDKMRDDIVHKLHQFSEGRALYDPKTLQQVGNFHGATHGAFWNLNRGSDSLEVECKIVSFKTSQVENTAKTQFADEKALGEASGDVAEFLLSQLSRSQVLSPKNESLCARNVSLEGYASYLPSDWTLWITIQPEGNALHFPQFRVTPQTDGYWSASDVYLGEENQGPRPSRFMVYIVVTAKQYTKEIDEYLGAAVNRGLNLNAWDKRFYRVLDHVRLTRVSTQSSGCAIPGS